jgi:glycosyltransferase involved in cell wall biosynthesis
MSGPKLLYVSPVVPAPGGSGRAMRAWHNLQALASEYDVSLLVTPAGLRHDPLPAHLEEICRRAACAPLRPLADARAVLRLVAGRLAWTRALVRSGMPVEWRAVTPRRLHEAADVVGGREFDVIHVFRLYEEPFAREITAHSRRELDLDDLESATRRSIAALHRERGRASVGRALEAEAAACEAAEDRALAGFDRVFVSSREERDALAARPGRASVEVLPNVVAAVAQRPRKHDGGDFALLLVGSFSYYPNLDALLVACDEVLPELRKLSRRPIAVHVVGPDIPSRVQRRLRSIPEVKIAGRVADVTPYYRLADAALLPLRAGGGTRIKALEAFARGVPVVSTALGVAGLGARDGEQALLGETPAALAGQCARLMESPDLAATLSRAALALAQERFAPARLRAILCPPANA